MKFNPIIVLAWLVLAGIAIMTLGPIDVRPSSPMPVDFERSAAFIVAGGLFAMAYPRHVWWTLAFLAVVIIGLEVMQNLRPDRHGRESDALVKLAAAAIGIGAGWLVEKYVIARLQRQ